MLCAVQSYASDDICNVMTLDVGLKKLQCTRMAYYHFSKKKIHNVKDSVLLIPWRPRISIFEQHKLHV